MQTAYGPDYYTPIGTVRTLLAIYQDLNALSAAKKTAIWNEITAGAPPLWSLAEGNPGLVAALCAASVAAIDIPTGTAYPVATQTTARMKMVAIYLWLYPKWLEAPAFDPTINVKGYTPFP